jgi:hypothetical protein
VGRLSDVHARLFCFPEIVRQVETLRAELAEIAADSPHATLVQMWCAYGAEVGRYLPLSLAPILDRSLIDTAIAVGWHSAPPRSVVSADLRDHADRLLMGQLIHAAKQYDSPLWSTDREDVQAIGSLAAVALAATRFGEDIDLIASVPSSRGTNSLPHQVVRDLSFLTRIRYAPDGAIRFQRQVPQVKEIRDYWTKRETIAASMTADLVAIRGRHVLIVDDVCRTGATLHECARACWHAGATRVTALAISKTWEFQRLPEPEIDDDSRWLAAR